MKQRARAVLFALALTGAAGAAAIAVAGDAQAQAVGRRPWLGIAMEDATSSPRAADAAVRITHVTSSSPADKAGVRDGDRLLKVDGAAVASATEVQRAVARHGIGDVVAVTVRRGASEQTLRITLAARPSADEQLRLDHLGKFAPAWTSLEGAHGDVPKSIDALRGRVVVVDFWATWCGPCRLTAPTLTSWQTRYGAQGLTVVGITTDDKETAGHFAERNGMRFAVASDETGATSVAYGVHALPTVFVIDKRGVVRDIALGYDPDHEQQMESLIRGLLAEPAPTN